MNRSFHRALVAAALSCALVACSQDRGEAPDRGSVTRLAEPREAIGEHLMLALGQAKNFHHKADVYLARAEPEKAVAALRQILAIDFPADAPEAADVRLDARARLGTVLAATGKLDEAFAVVDEGLAGAPRPSFFLANLYTVRGELHEARAALVAESDPATAEAEQRAAIADYDHAISINEKLLAGLTGGAQ